MNNTNYEIKARVSVEKQNEVRAYLKAHGADFKINDVQVDTYFKVKEGRRLKIRKSKLENVLIDYLRPNQVNSKKSEVQLFYLNSDNYLEDITRKTHEVLVEVVKQREIYFIDNIKFHIDNVEGLGTFVEIEAISEDNLPPLEKIKEQCEFYQNEFGIKEEDLIPNSYSDMLMEEK